MIFYSKENDLAGEIVQAYESVFGSTYPAHKYKKVKELLEADDIGVTETDGKFSDDDLLLVHSKELVDSLNSALCKDYFTGIGYATHLAARYALENGYAVNIGGGFHHCKSGEAGSCCLINDIAVSVTKLRQEVDKDLKVLIIDLDCHQGDGNAEIFHKDPNTYTYSMHKNKIYPNPENKKVRSNKDVGLWKNNPIRYLNNLYWFCSEFDNLEFQPDIIYYIAGADTYKEDKWTDGGLGLSFEDLQERDRMVYELAKERGIPIVTILGGGYADVDDVAKIHYNTIITMMG